MLNGFFIFFYRIPLKISIHWWCICCLSRIDTAVEPSWMPLTRHTLLTFHNWPQPKLVKIKSKVSKYTTIIKTLFGLSPQCRYNNSALHINYWRTDFICLTICTCIQGSTCISLYLSIIHVMLLYEIKRYFQDILETATLLIIMIIIMAICIALVSATWCRSWRRV